LAVAVNEDPGTIEEIYEPYLIQQGFLDRTMQGRRATIKAYKHLKREIQSAQYSLFNDQE